MLTFSFAAAVLLVASAKASVPQSCESPVYCYGELLHTVQMARVFEDSKTFVDRKMKVPQQEVLKRFDKFMEENQGNPTKEKVSIFVNENFEDGVELENWTPNDYKSNPKFLGELEDEVYREFASHLVSIWPNLTRTVKKDVFNNSDRYSLIPVPNGFVVPGGRFRETYYWDTYWIIRGLLISEMHETAKGMLENFISLIDRYGFIPNGGRVYYLRRSQPPLFVPMVYQYIKATNNVAWLKDNIKYLEMELLFWHRNRMVKVVSGGKSYSLARYMPSSLGPRPESYREDYQTVLAFPPQERERVYQDLKAGAESGWDFSSRWFYDPKGGVTSNLTNIHTRRTIPVDLNSFLYLAYVDISELYHLVGDYKNSSIWKRKARDLKAAIQAVFWNEEQGIWFDYDFQLKTHRKYFFPSNLAPLWAKAFNINDTSIADRVVDYLEDQKVFEFLGGTPASLLQSGEQWDYPNAWPPLQDIMVGGLYNGGSTKSKEKAISLAKLWLHANIVGQNQTGEMFEKYDAVNVGGYGGGGEYNVQSGFGWTNGVCLEFMYKFFRKTV